MIVVNVLLIDDLIQDILQLYAFKNHISTSVIKAEAQVFMRREGN